MSLTALLRAAGVCACVCGLTSCTLWNGHHERLNYRTIPSDPHHDTEKACKENQRGLCLVDAGELDQAEQRFQKSLIADVGYGPAHNNLGHVYYARGELYLAAWEFECAIQVMPDRPEPHNNLGLVHEAAGKIEEAVVSYNTAHEMEPTNAEYLGNLVRARLKRGESVDLVRDQLSQLVFLDSRPSWVAWAKEVLALSDTASETAHTLPVPDGVPRVTPNSTDGSKLPPMLPPAPPEPDVIK